MSLLFQQKTKSAPQVDNPYWMSFSDMMSGMLIIFILVCIALLYKLSKIEYDVNQNIIVYNKSIEERTKILEDIKNDLLNQAGIKVEITDNDSVIRIPEGSLHFDNAKFELIDWLSTLSGIIFLMIRMGDVGRTFFIIGSIFCILEGVLDLFLYFKQSKKKRKIARLLYSMFLILASIQGIIMLYAKM